MNRELTNNIQLNWLRTFEAAGRHLSFTLAAQDLNMSQSAISQQIQLLEHHLDQQLFVRANRSIQLTDAGRSFLPLVQESMQQLNSGAAKIFSPQNQAIIDINVNYTFSSLWLAPRLQHFHAMYPSISVRQLSTNWPSDFSISTCDLEIRYGNGHWQGYNSHLLISPQLRPYCTADNAKRIRQPSDLENMALLDIIGTPLGWNDWLQSRQLSHLQRNIRHYMDTYTEAASMAANGFGLCLIYDELMLEGVLAKQLVAPFVDSIDSPNSYYLCYQRDKKLSATSVIFKDWLLSQVSTIVDR